MANTVQKYISDFQSGNDFRSPSEGLVLNHTIDLNSLELMRKELAKGQPQLRENIVKLLRDIGGQLNKGYPDDDSLRDARIIKILATEGLEIDDLGRQAAIEALRRYSTRDSLSAHGDRFTTLLAKSPDPSLLLLIAKAKVNTAKVTVDKLAADKEWNDEEAVKIAQAALGNTAIEDQYIKNAKDAKDGKSLAEALRVLGLVGTKRSLITVAQHLRTPYTVLIERASETSVRLDALDALSYNYPAEKILYRNSINSQSDYLAAEKFCTNTLGVTFDGSPPPFLTYRPFPVPVPKR